MKSKILLLSFIVIASCSITINAQTVPSKSTGSDLKIMNDSINHKVDIEFTVDKEISNLLVLVSDSLGNTLFLDNQYRFKGNYKHTLDFKERGKKWYSLKIIKDEEQISKKINN